MFFYNQFLIISGLDIIRTIGTRCVRSKSMSFGFMEYVGFLNVLIWPC
jgi:hypothetical protein